MTPEQLDTFKADILANADQDVQAWVGAGAVNYIASWYNQEASPATVVWKTSIGVDDANDAIDWTEYMDVPVLGGDDIAGVKLAMEQNTAYARQNNALNQLFRNGTFNPSLQTIRDALNDIFSGDPNTKAALLEMAKRNATYVEALFAGEPVQGAGVMGFEGSCSGNDVSQALSRP